MGDSISYHLEMPFQYKTIRHFCAEEALNNHMFITGELLIESPAIRTDFVSRFAYSPVYIKDTNENVVLAAFITSISTVDENDYCYASFKAYGYSKQLDLEHYSCSFQKIHETTYSEMLSFVYNFKEDAQVLISNKADVIISRGIDAGDCRLTKPVIMYNESIWLFTLRMAGRAGTIITPNNRSVVPQVLFGLPSQHISIVDGERAIVKRSLNRYTKYKDKYKSTDIKDLLVKSKNNFNLGSAVKFDNVEYCIASKTTVFSQAEFVIYYRLALPEAVIVPPFENGQLCGLMLRGTVTGRHNDTVNVFLDIDKSRDTAAFPFRHDTQAVSGMQGVPEMDTEVWLYVNGENTPYIESGIQHTNSQHGNYNYRSFENEIKKFVYFLNKQLSFITENNKVSLTDEVGENCSATCMINIKARRTVIIKTFNALKFMTLSYFKATKTGKYSGLEVYNRQMHLSSRTVKIKTYNSKPENPPIPTHVAKSVKVNLEFAKNLLGGLRK